MISQYGSQSGVGSARRISSSGNKPNMKILISSDDGVEKWDVHTADVDWSGHSLNRVVLMDRVKTALNKVAVYESAQEKAKDLVVTTFMKRWKDKEWPPKGMSGRLRGVLRNLGITSVEQAFLAFTSGRLNPKGWGESTRNYGWACQKELAAILGVPEPKQFECYRPRT